MIDRKGKIYWITGLSGSGKTTVGTALYYRLKRIERNVVILDGAVLKELLVEDEDAFYTKEKREVRAWKYAKICKVLADQGVDVICCTISMFNNVREWNRTNNYYYVEIFLDTPIGVLAKRNKSELYSKFSQGIAKNVVGMDLDWDKPGSPDIILTYNKEMSEDDYVDVILNNQPKYKGFIDDTSYWEEFYSNSNTDIEAPSLFAEALVKENHLNDGKTVLELGCGNGRDSIYFSRNGLKVTAIDASKTAIDKLISRKTDVLFVCDDFISSPTLYKTQYDYCYSRFTLHAISEKQQRELFSNIYYALAEQGKFFIEVRSIYDDLCGKGERVGEFEYIYNGHYRRFLKKEALIDEIKKSGFIIEYVEEKTGFAPHREEDPVIIRLIATKNTTERRTNG